MAGRLRSSSSGRGVMDRMAEREGRERGDRGSGKEKEKDKERKWLTRALSKSIQQKLPGGKSKVGGSYPLVTPRCISLRKPSS